MRFSIILLLLVVGCSGSGNEAILESGSTTTLAGTIVDINLEPMAVDGDGVITLETADGATARVFVSARANLCAAEGLAVIGELAVGDRVEAHGRVVGGANVRPCEGEGDFLRRTDG